MEPELNPYSDISFWYQCNFTFWSYTSYDATYWLAQTMFINGLIYSSPYRR